MHNPQSHPCRVAGCNRDESRPFRRKWNLLDHVKRVHKDQYPTADDNVNYSTRKRQREHEDDETRCQTRASKHASMYPPTRGTPLTPMSAVQRSSNTPALVNELSVIVPSIWRCYQLMLKSPEGFVFPRDFRVDARRLHQVAKELSIGRADSEERELCDLG